MGVRLSSRRVSREGARRESKGEAPHAPLSRRRELGVGGAWARLSSTGVWMPTERVLTGDLRRGVGVDEGVGVLGAVSCDEAEVRSPRRERRRGNGDNANWRNEAITRRHFTHYTHDTPSRYHTPPHACTRLHSTTHLDDSTQRTPEKRTEEHENLRT